MKNLRNLVIITADDLNADSAGWMGSMVGATPQMDAFAAGCHQLRNCHTVVPICQPSRAALMTGLVPHRNGAVGFGPVRPDVTTLPEIMARHGYFTAAINKLHHMMPPQKFNWDLGLEGSGKNPAALRAQFEQCLKAAAETRRPFFINANSTDPHGPFPTKQATKQNQSSPAAVELFTETEILVPPFLEDLPEVRQEIARYFSAVRRFDETFGGLIAALKTRGHFADTIVLFVSDHGMGMPYAKATLYRTATCTPVLLRFPGMVRPIINNEILANIDILPTLLNLLGLEKPSQLDGTSWLAILEGKKQSDRHHIVTQIDSVHSGKTFPSRCIRTKHRAYIWNSWADGKTPFRMAAMSTRSSWKAMIEAAKHQPTLRARVDHLIYRCPEEFYNNENDPHERHNLIADPQYKSEITELKRRLLTEMEKTNDPLAPQFLRAQSSAPENLFSRWRRNRKQLARIAENTSKT